MVEKKKRIVILLGAGAAVPWGGQLTNDLTDSIIELSQTKTKNGACTKFLSFLQLTLADNLNKTKGKDIINRKDINFEILLSLIEYLFEFYWHRNLNSKLEDTPEWVGLFNCIDEIEKEIPGKILIQNGDDTPYWAYENNKHLRDFSFKIDKSTNKQIIADEFLNANFFKQLHEEVTYLIRDHVDTYSKKTIYNEKLSKLFQFINYKNNNVIRSYSTNYDDLISEIKPIDKIFNGFDKIVREEIKSTNPILTDPIPSIKEYNINAILNDMSINCFYNLHGNFKFTIDADGNREINYQETIYNLKQTAVSYLGNRQILNNTIISGQQKTLRTSSEPYKSFFNVFHRDCLAGDIILCIGFSFSDFHINQILQEAIHYGNDALRFIIVTYEKEEEINKSHNNLSQMILGKELDYMFEVRHHFTEINNKPNWYNGNLSSTRNTNIKMKKFVGGFEEFLKGENNWKEVID